MVTLGLTKRFGKRLAVDGLDLRIPVGSITGFVGPNGAGKTTTIRMLLGLIRPTSGRGTVLGHPLGHSRAYLPRVGALIEGPTFYPALSGRENLMVLARLGGIQTKRVDVVLRRVGLGPRALDPFRTYSLGMRQRLGIGAALLPSPQLLVLDEPTNGLDPHGIAEIRAMLQVVRRRRHDRIRVFAPSRRDPADLRAPRGHRSGPADLSRRCGGALGRPRPRADRANRDGAGRGAASATGAQHRPQRRAWSATARARLSRSPRTASWAGELNRLAMADGITLVHLAERRSTLEEAFFEITRSVSRTDALGQATSLVAIKVPVGPGRLRRDGHDLEVVRE